MLADGVTSPQWSKLQGFDAPTREKTRRHMTSSSKLLWASKSSWAMTDIQLSESDYAEACRIVEIFFATQRYARNEGVQPKRLQNFYAEQLDQTDTDIVARKRANFPSAVVRMIEVP
jgi:hypothetical protein